MAKDSGVFTALTADTHARAESQYVAGLRKAGSKKMLPLSALFLSPDNVRSTEPAGPALDELAALIDSQGLINGLQVTAEIVEGSPTGRYGVQAGGRRYRALMLLVKQGKISASEPIDCTVIDSINALEVSLTENITQEPMHPADAFVAFQKMIAQGHSVEAISSRFGVTVLQVQRRLRLANVAPEFMTLYRQGEITLDVVMALASVDDHERQLRAWHSLSSYGRTAQGIKRKLTEEEVPESDVRAQVVGLEAYAAAGGGVRADLFSEAGMRYLTDPGLLDTMLAQALERKAEAVRAEGWSWVEILPAFGYQERKLYSFPTPEYLDETAEHITQRTAWEDQISELEAKAENASDEQDWEATRQLEKEIEGLEEKVEALQESRLDWDGVDKSVSGAVIFLDGDKITVKVGVFRVADLKSNTSSTGGAAYKAPKPDVPERLMLDLSSHRTAAIQALMVKNERVALAALAHRMAFSLFDSFRTSPVKISLTLSRSTLERNSSTLAASPAAAAMDAEHALWVERLPKDSEQWFDWLLQQPQEVVLSLIVFATANTVDAIQGQESSATGAVPVAKALGLDMADWWQPTPQAYLELVPKAKLVEAVTQAVGATEAIPLLKMKKQEAVTYAAQQLQGTRWLPRVLA